MSIIRFGCDSCGHPIEVSEDHIGSLTRCPACSDQVEVPGGRKQSWFEKIQNHKFLLTLIGCILICTSLLMMFSPPQNGLESAHVNKSKKIAPLNPELAQRWRDDADADLAGIATNQPGFERLIRSVCFGNGSDDPNKWTGFVDIEYGNRHGMHDHTNILVRFGLVQGLDEKSNVVCFPDGFAMERRSYEAHIEELRAQQQQSKSGVAIRTNSPLSPVGPAVSPLMQRWKSPQ